MFERPSRVVEYYEELVERGRLTQAAAASEFAAHLGSGVRGMMDGGVKAADAVWPQVVKQERSTKAWEKYAGTSIPTGIKKVQPGQEAPDMDFTSDSTVLHNERYAGKLKIPRELLEDDQTGEIRRRVTGTGEALVEFEDQTVADVFNNGNSTTAYDGSAIFANNHPNVTGGATNTNNDNLIAAGAATEANMETALKAVNTWVGWNGKAIHVGIKALLTGTTNWTNILRLVRSTSSQSANVAAGVINAFQSIGTPILWKRLAAAAWFIVTDVDGLIYQLRRPMEVKQENMNSGSSLLCDAYVYVVTKRFAVKVTNWRAMARGNS
jgi:phage major head subunit gpT-like protein